MNTRLIRWMEWAAWAGLALGSLRLLAGQFTRLPTQSEREVTIGILLTLLICIVHAGASKGWQKALGFTGFAFFVTWLVEFIGCNYGWWFGDYGYTDKLGYAIGNVPLLVVVSWEVIIYPSHLLADWLLPRRASKHWQQAVSAALMTALFATVWDTMTDPLAVHRQWWTWDTGGDYLRQIGGGIPFSNYWGWVGAVFIISLVYRLCFENGRDTAIPAPAVPRFAIILYTSLFVGNFGSLLEYGLIEAAFIGCFTMGTIVLLGWARWWSAADAQQVSRT